MAERPSLCSSVDDFQGSGGTVIVRFCPAGTQCEPQDELCVLLKIFPEATSKE